MLHAAHRSCRQPGTSPPRAPATPRPPPPAAPPTPPTVPPGPPAPAPPRPPAPAPPSPPAPAPPIPPAPAPPPCPPTMLAPPLLTAPPVPPDPVPSAPLPQPSAALTITVHAILFMTTPIRMQSRFQRARARGWRALTGANRDTDVTGLRASHPSFASAITTLTSS